MTGLLTGLLFLASIFYRFVLDTKWKKIAAKCEQLKVFVCAWKCQTRASPTAHTNSNNFFIFLFSLHFNSTRNKHYKIIIKKNWTFWSYVFFSLVIYSAFGFICNEFFFCSHQLNSHTFRIVANWMRHSCLNEYRENIKCSVRRHISSCQTAEKLNEYGKGKWIWRRLSFGMTLIVDLNCRLFECLSAYWI